MKHLNKSVLYHNLRYFFGSKKPAYDLGKCSLITDVGRLSAERSVPDTVVKPPYYYEMNRPSSHSGKPEIKSIDQINKMRESCKLAANVLKKCDQIVGVGIKTDEIDEFVHNEIISAQAYPSPLRYLGFPKSVCTSVNNVACHGIPDSRELVDGDIINVDITVYLNGFHGDCSKTYLVGNVDDRGRYLVECTEQSLCEAIKVCGPYQSISLIGKCISRFAKKKGLTTIPAFIGHGIGSYFHGPPEILHFDNDERGAMLPGMTFTIEPILTLGSEEIEILEDMWTAVTVDNARSAQFEHTILITENGAEILTLPD